MQLWQDYFFKDDSRLLTRACLKLIRDHREGELVDLSLIRRVVQSYGEYSKRRCRRDVSLVHSVQAGFTEEDRRNPQNRSTVMASLKTYRDFFEAEFLQETDVYYQVLANNILADFSVLEYLKKVTLRNIVATLARSRGNSCSG